MPYSRQLSGITLFFFTLLLCVGFLSLASCKKDTTNEEEETAIEVKGSVIINGAYTTFSRSSLYITGVQELNNYMILSRTDNSEIILRFPGTEEITHEISAGDSLVTIQYRDAGQRIFNADSGRIQVADYSIKDGVFTISGGFEFHAARFEQIGGSIFTIHVRGKEGGFVDISTE